MMNDIRTRVGVVLLLLACTVFCKSDAFDSRFLNLPSNALFPFQEPELDTTLGGEAGFIQINQTYDSNTFYWFFPSQDGNQSAPLILWLEGGPGIPGTFSVFAGPGPYRLEYSIPLDFGSNLTLLTNNYTWNLHNHLLFVDNPIGTGFSYTNDPAGFPINETQVSSDLLTFMNLFLKLYPEYVSNDFFIAGESYGGKYAFALTSLIIEEKEQTASQIYKNLKGIILGDPLIDPATQAATWGSYAVSTGILNEMGAMTWMNQTVNPIIDEINAGNYSGASPIYYEAILNRAMLQNTSIYNIVQYALPLSNIWTASYVGYLALVNSTAVRKQLNVYPHVYQYFSDYAFYNDVSKPVSPLFSTIISQFPVLIYNGQLDWLINVQGTQNWLGKVVGWVNQNEFVQAPLKPVTIPLNDYPFPILGYLLQSGGNMSFAVIPNSGHFGLLDNPYAVLELVTGFIQENQS